MMLTILPASHDTSDVIIKIAEAPRIEPAYAGFRYDVSPLPGGTS